VEFGVASPIRIVIIEEQQLLRIGLEHVLMREPEFLVVGAGATAADALALVAAEEPDMIFLDILGGGIKTATEIRRRHPRTRVLFLTSSERHEDVTAALQAGASAYMLKGIAPDSLVQTLRVILAGETYIMPQLATRLLVSASQKPKSNNSAAAERLDSLTARERQILKEVSEGQTNKEIARKLEITEKTVKHYMGRVLQKLCVRNRTEAVVISQSVRNGDSEADARI
jgi:DNA-binding NarL/FixJ family response regulator